MIKSLLPGTAERVRCLLENEFGPGYWDGFQRYMCESGGMHGHEWRFGGQLGFGGKVHLSGGRLYVSAYPEDLNPDLCERMMRITADLAAVLDDMRSLSSRETNAPKEGTDA